MANPADRRKHRRFKTKLPVLIQSDSGLLLSATVQDYCDGGMLLSFAPDAANQQVEVGQDVHLTTYLPSQGGRQSVEASGAIVWSRQNLLGIQFEQPRPDFVAQIQANDEPSAQTKSASRQNFSRSDNRLLDRIRDLAQKQLTGVMQQLVDETWLLMDESAVQCQSDSERQQLFGDMLTIKELRSDDVFLKAVMDRALQPATSDEPADESSSKSELSLLDKEDFERWLESSRVTTVLENRYRSPVAILGARMLALSDSDMEAGSEVPFEPKHFTDALTNVVKDHELGAWTHRLLFETANEVLSSALGEFYRLINEELDRLGAPQQNISDAMRLGFAGNKLATVGTAEGSKQVPPGYSQTQAESVNTGAIPTVSADTARILIDAAQLDQVLNQERQARKQRAQEMVTDMKAEVDPETDASVWLGWLGSSLVEQAASNPLIFQQPSHPLLSIADQLEYLDRFLGPPEDAITAKLTQHVGEMLMPLSRGAVDEELLESIAERIETLAKAQGEDYARNVQKVVEACEGRERIRHSRLMVAADLDRRYAGHKVPVSVIELLKVGWRSLLDLAWLKASNDISEYAKYLGLLDALIEHLGGQAYAPGSGERDSRKLMLQITEMLATTAVDPYHGRKVEQRILGELSGEISPIEMEQMPTFKLASPPAIRQRPASVERADWRDLVERCSKLKLGDQVRFKKIDAEKATLRVAWIRPDRESFTLVNQRGLRAQVMSLAELALALHEQRVSFTAADGTPLTQRVFDRTLGKMEKSLSAQVDQDSLPGLLNRRQFQKVLDKGLIEGLRGVVLWIDIDQFKLINDLYGYDAGDRLLVAFAGLIQRSDDTEVIAHLGADRFAVLLDGAGVEKATQWADRLLEQIHSQHFDWLGRAAHLEASVGMVILDDVSDSVGELTRAAEDALSLAKRMGGGRSYLYREEDPTLVRERDAVEWLVKVDEALLDGELRLRCQPIVPVRPDAGLHSHHEILLGVVNSANETLSIIDFIEAAERYNRMLAVDRWVTKTVFDWVAQHRSLMPMIHGLAVNLSGQTASDASFVDFVRQQFDRTGIKPEWISFEVTETAAVSSLTHTAEIIQGLKRLGCRIALDDFGSGQASYSYLKHLPVDWLKIDGVFVRDIATSPEDLAVVKSINEIGHFLGKKTIAEFVKDQATLDLVRGIGVDFAQGYCISRPILLDDLVETYGSIAQQASLA